MVSPLTLSIDELLADIANDVDDDNTWSHRTHSTGQLLAAIANALDDDNEWSHLRQSTDQLLTAIANGLSDEANVSGLSLSTVQLLAAITNSATGETTWSGARSSVGELLAAIADSNISSGPSIALSASTIAEDADAGDLVGTFSVSGGSGSYTFTLTDTAGNRFAVDGDDLERGATALDYESATSHSIAVEADNGTDPVISRSFTVSVTNVDETAPTITSGDTNTVAENAILSHSLTANESVTWSIIGGADQARFEIGGSTLRWASNGTKNYEAPNDANTDNAYVVTVRATDAGTNTTDQTVTVTVTNVVEAPVNSVAPAITGTETEGETLNVSNGTWAADSTNVYTYQWFRAITLDGDIVTLEGLFTGVAIDGATISTYELTADDVDELLYCEVTATNGVGAAMKQSNATAAIADDEPALAIHDRAGAAILDRAGNFIESRV